MYKRVLYLVLIIIIISIPAYGISLTQDIIYNDALDASIKLNSNFVELEPGESFEFEATVTGLSCCDVTYSVDNSEYVTLSENGKKGTVTVNKDAENFGELTVQLTARAVSASITDVATIAISEPPKGSVNPWPSYEEPFRLFPDVTKDFIMKLREEPIEHMNEGRYSTY